MPLDGFLILKRGGATAVLGETLDKAFSEKDGVSINSFEFGSGAGGMESAADDEAGDTDADTEANDTAGQGSKAPKTETKPTVESHKKKKKKRKGWSFEITKDVDKSTPQLFEAYCEHAEAEKPEAYTAKVVLRKSGGPRTVNYLEMTFYEVRVISFELKSESDKLPKETVAFSFQKCKYRYTAQRPDGTSRPNEKTFDWRKLPN
jgi:type VI secretion system Hcp family effector